MSALPKSLPRLRPMCATDLDAVMAIEQSVYHFPWTRGNFSDSLAAGYSCWVLECAGAVAGYGVMALGADEAHLLNLSVARDWQRRGLGRKLLTHFAKLARECHALMMFLEVRPSNTAARALYADFGFTEIAVRRKYYPAGRGREDALVMGMPL